jgi:hypothetical protein
LFGKPAGTIVGWVTIDGEKRYSPIPAEVFTMIKDAVPKDRRQNIEVPGSDHGVTRWMRENQNQANSLVAQIAEFIMS